MMTLVGPTLSASTVIKVPSADAVMDSRVTLLRAALLVSCQQMDLHITIPLFNNYLYRVLFTLQ